MYGRMSHSYNNDDQNEKIKLPENIYYRNCRFSMCSCNISIHGKRAIDDIQETSGKIYHNLQSKRRVFMFICIAFICTKSRPKIILPGMRSICWSFSNYQPINSAALTAHSSARQLHIGSIWQIVVFDRNQNGCFPVKTSMHC